MRLTVLLGGHLRHEALNGPMERTVEMPERSNGSDLIAVLGLPEHRIKMIFVNNRAATLKTVLNEGDRVAFFPPELSYNTFVALSYSQDRIEDAQSD